MTATRQHRHRLSKVGSLGGVKSITTQTKGIQMLAQMGLSICLTVTFVAPVSAASPPSQRHAIEIGRSLAQAHCATCHAIGPRGQSPNLQAPRFATLEQRYPLDNLAEALSEGILVGHGPMPEFRFEPNQIDGLIVYLRSIQSPVKRARKRAPK